MKDEGVLETIRKTVSAFDGVELAILFGSYAEGRQTPVSDVDIAVLTEKEEVRPRLRMALAEALKMPLESISLIDLAHTPPTLRLKILGKGITLVGSNETAKRVLDTLPPDAVETVEVEKGEFRRWLKASNPIDENVLKAIVTQVEEDTRYLTSRLDKSTEEIAASDDLRRAFERALHTAIEGVLDMLRHTVSGLSLGVPEAYRDYVAIAERGGVISQDTAEKLLSLVELRHTLVHRYRGLNYAELIRAANALVRLWPNIREEVRGYLKTHLGENRSKNT